MLIECHFISVEESYSLLSLEIGCGLMETSVASSVDNLRIETRSVQTFCALIFNEQCNCLHQRALRSSFLQSAILLNDNILFHLRAKLNCVIQEWS